MVNMKIKELQELLDKYDEELNITFFVDGVYVYLSELTLTGFKASEPELRLQVHFE